MPVALVVATLIVMQGLLLQRPLPTIDGHYRLLGLHERAEVVRDAFGVPRIEAGDAHDLFFLQGYVTAQDRLAQMEEMRAGAEPYRDAADIGLASAGADLRAVLGAYAEGVTKYIAQHAAARALPAEIALAGRRPQPWTAVDPLAIAAAYLEGPTRSICIAVSAERAFRGRPIVATELDSDPPPPGWYEIGLSGGGIRAIGISLPGVPGIAAGHNGLVAWSLHGSRSRPIEPRRALDVVLASMRAHTVAELLVPAVGAAGGPLEGCLADLSGNTGALIPAQLPPAFESGGMTGDVQLLQLAAFRLGVDKALDVEAIRLLVRDAFPLLHPPLPPFLGGPSGPPEPAQAGARLVIDLGDLDASKAALSTGQSAHRAAFHYRDQVPLWEAGQLHRLAWTREAVARTEGQLVFRAR